MKIVLKYAIVMTVLTVILILIIGFYSAYQTKKAFESRIQSLQHCCFDALHGGTNCVDEFDSRRFTVIVYFQTECEHCQYEASEIGKNREQFKKANIVMITPDTITEKIKAFETKYNLGEKGNLTILLDGANQFEHCFGISNIPSVYIYGTDKKLIIKYFGETKISEIISKIN